MLTQLHIRNFTLIDTLDIHFQSGFSVITGETGAGKSIIIGAISLLMGQRADLKTIKQGTDKCIIEAHFNLSNYHLEGFFRQNDVEYDENDCIIRRELTAAGKSRAFINDTPVSLNSLKELGEQLIDVHSQHQNLLLNKQDFQLSVVDIIADDAQLLSDYRESFDQYQASSKQLAVTKEEIERNQANADFLKFQHDELSAAGLQDGEQEELEQRSETMSHAEEIKSALYIADNSLSADDTGIVDLLGRALSSTESICHVFPSASDLAERLQSCRIELKDISEEIGSLLNHVDFDPAELDAVNSRLDTLYNLQKKYHCQTVADLITLREQLALQLNQIDNSEEALEELSQRVKQERQACENLAKQLTQVRKEAAAKIEKQMLGYLVPLGMPNVKFRVDIESIDNFNKNGNNRVSFLFSANTNSALQPVAQIASGGEIARVMLAIKAMISGAVKLPTIIFDEIDTGVSGKIAEQMAQIMLQMGSAGRQVVSITHLPQIAALGSSHYKVLKEETPTGTVSRMRLLQPKERINEIAQMLSGSNITQAAIDNARELLSL